VFRGNGDGSLRPATPYSVTGGCSSPQLVDLNLDGKLDIAETNVTTSTLGVLLGNGDGTFQTMMPFSTDSGARAVAVGDLNGDGKPDLAVVNEDAADLSVFLNTSH
jgi:hypothetical protein